MEDSLSAAIKTRFYSLFPVADCIPSVAVPVFINCFNRLTGLQQLVERLLRSGHRRVVILDNQSTYPPLLQYLQTIADDLRITVVRLQGNLGHYALWASGILRQLDWHDRFAYTDPDILPDVNCPSDFIEHFDFILERQSWAMKAGFGLVIDDIPESYRFKREVLTWEQQFWDVPVGFNEYHAPIDTTFALYRRGAADWNFQAAEDAKYMAIRTGKPYLARHLDWYIDSDSPTEEQTYYRRFAVPGVTSWSLDELPENVKRDVGLVKQGVRIIPIDFHKPSNASTTTIRSRIATAFSKLRTRQQG